MMTLQRLPGLFELILIGLAGFLYFLYVAKISYIAIVLKTSFRNVFIKLIFRSIYFLLIIVSILAPSFGDVKREIKSIGKDIYFLVDLSGSMNTADIQPSRLEKLKYELKKITETFYSDRMGLIIFSSEAYIQCPLTIDVGALELFIETLQTHMVPAEGTDFAPALELALKRFSTSETSASSSNSKIIVLASDGEDFGDDMEYLAYKLDREGIKVFTIGIGTDEGGRVPSAQGGYKRDEKGKAVVSKLNREALQKLAEVTNGKYYEVSNSKNEILRLITDISSIEGELREIKTIDASANKYFYFLAVALIMVMLDALITVKTIRI